MNLNDYFKTYRDKPCEKYLAEVLQAAQSLIFGIVVKVTNHAHDAEDLTQEILIKVIQNINLLPQDINFGGWLNRVSLNAAIDHYHQKQRIKALKPNVQEINTAYSVENEDEKIAIIYQHLSKLESNEESLILNKYIHLLTYDQMSFLYKQPRTTIESKINNILKKLKVSIEKAGFAGVALALASTLEQLKAAEVTLDLLPKIQSHFPATYPKVKSDVFSFKVLLKVLVPIVAILIAYFAVENFKSPSQIIGKPLTEIAKQDKQIKESGEPKAEIKTNYNQENFQNELSEPDSNPDNKKPIANADIVPIIKEEPKAALENEYAGQLVDAETKKPIAEAKLEIWDIYTYEKFETNTDAEGKYFIPKGLDTTFFFYLKFIKKGYAVKQTFQHFEIHKKVTINMNIGNKISYYLEFKNPVMGDLFLGSMCNLKNEEYLTVNQKSKLAIVFSNLKLAGPIELFTFKKIQRENLKSYILTEEFDLPLNSPMNDSTHFIYFRNNEYGIYEYNLLHKDGINSFDLKNPNYKLIFGTKGKIVSNKEIKIISIRNFVEKYSSTDHEGITNQSLEGEGVSIEDSDYYFGPPINLDISSFENGISRLKFLYPYSKVVFDPLLLNYQYHNVQAFFGDEVFSKKSLFKKTRRNNDTLNVYDQYFEKILLTQSIKTPLGGIVDINRGLNLNFKDVLIKILVDNKLLKSYEVEIFDEKVPFNKWKADITMNENGLGLIKIPFEVNQISIYFEIENMRYKKTIDLNKLKNDSIVLNFNRKIDIKISQAVHDSNIKAFNMEKEYNNMVVSKDYYGVFYGKRILNENTSIYFPPNQQFVFLEKDMEYVIIEGRNSGIKTKYNQLRATNMVVPDHIEEIEIKPISDLEYNTFQLEFLDESGNEIKNLNWRVWDKGLFQEFEPSINNLKMRCLSSIQNEFYQLRDNDNWIDATCYEEMTIGTEGLKNKRFSLLKNRNYLLFASAEGFMEHVELFNTITIGQTNKRVILRRPNSVKFIGNFENNFNEIIGLLKSDDVIYEYNGVRVKSSLELMKSQKECTQEKVIIKLIRDKMPIALFIPAYLINGLEDNYYDDKDDLLFK